MLVLEVYWCGLAEERQQSTAKQVRDLLRKFEALKERMQTWARKEIARRVPTGRRIGEGVPNTLDDEWKQERKDFRARHPKQGIF